MVYPESAPTIIVDSDLGQLLNGVEFNVEEIVKILMDSGLSSDQINSLTINLTKEYQAEKKGDNKINGTKGELVAGKYNLPSKCIDLYIESIIGNCGVSKTDPSLQANHTLVHELGHAVNHLKGTYPESTLRMLPAKILGNKAVGAIFKPWLSDKVPKVIQREEERAELFTLKNANNEVVTLDSKGCPIELFYKALFGENYPTFIK